MERNRDVRKVVWSDDRDAIFIKWFAEDAALLLDAGFSLDEAKKMLCSLNYVKVWAANPRWFYPITGLPKEYRWRDGEKFVQKRRPGRGDAQTYIFLPIGEDLYIKGVAAVGTHITDYRGAKIKQFRTLAFYEVTEQLSRHGACPNSFFEDSLLKFWHSQGLRLFNRPSYLRPLCKQQQTSDEDESKPP